MRDELGCSEARTSILEALNTAIEVDHAAKGNVQVLDRARGALEIVAHRGFDSSFLQLFQAVRADEPSACSRALLLRRRVAIHDITEDPLFWPYLSISQANGFRAVQSTPIIGSAGSVIGILSTHFATVHHLSEAGGVALDDCAARLARLIEGVPGNRESALQ